MQLVEVAVSTQQYVNYDKKTGEVKSVGPNKDLDYSSIEVSEKEIEPITSLKETMSDYAVVLNTKKQRYELRKITLDLEQDFPFVEVKENDQADLFLVIDRINKTCYIKLKEGLENLIKERLAFSITKKGDPHMLYTHLNFDTQKQQTHKFTLDNFSVYTNCLTIDCGVKDET